MLYDRSGHMNTYDAIPMKIGKYETRTGAKRRLINTKG